MKAKDTDTMLFMLQRLKYPDARNEDFGNQLISLLESIDMNAVCESQAEEVG
jgi:hypothetical protein